MSTYNFLLWVSESGSCVYSAPFTDDASALAYLNSLDLGIYQIIKLVELNPGTFYGYTILDQRS